MELRINICKVLIGGHVDGVNTSPGHCLIKVRHIVHMVRKQIFEQAGNNAEQESERECWLRQQVCACGFQEIC